MPPDKLEDKYNHVLRYWAHGERAVRAESIEAGRAAQRADAAADVAAACATLFWMEGEEDWRFACGVKVVGQRRRARPTCDGGLSGAISGVAGAMYYVMIHVVGGVRAECRALRGCVRHLTHMLGYSCTCVSSPQASI